ncbi:MAG: DUF2993 domain-containing protein [Actinobacteria bacterium]|nr:DUF2993 domain-containing protein [Actinomycetota bacterium]
MPVRRRRWDWLALVIVVLVLIVIVVVADRVGVALAQSAAEKYLSQQADFEGSPKVDIHGVPFLTQAISGKYDDVEVSGRQVRLDGLTGTDLDVHLHDAKISLAEAFSRSVRSVPCSSIDGRVTLPFSAITSLVNVQGLSLTWADNAISVRVSVPVLGKSEVATGLATASVQKQKLQLHISKVAVAGVSLPDSVVNQLVSQLSAPVSLPQLPYNLAINTASVGPAGVLLVAHSGPVVLRQQ